MNNDNWQANSTFIKELSLIELQRRWVKEKSALQTLCNQIEEAISHAESLQININGPKGCGKSHLLHLLLKHLADYYLPSTKAATTATKAAPLKLVFIDQNGAQINHYNELLSAILEQCYNGLENPIEETDKALENELLENKLAAQLQTTPIVIFIEQFDQLLAAIGSSGKKSLINLMSKTESKNNENALSWIVSQKDVATITGFKDINLTALTELQTQRLIEQLLTKQNETKQDQAKQDQVKQDQVKQDQVKPDQAKQQPRAQLKLCSAMLHRLFAGNGHYYHNFINTIGPPKLEQLSEQISHFIAQQAPLATSNIALLAPQQRQIVTLLSRQDLKHLGAVAVTHIANKLGMTHQTTSSQLKKLKDSAWVTSTKVGRLSYYQLKDISQSYSLAPNHLHPLQTHKSGINISIDFAHQWLIASTLDLPSFDGQNFITDKNWLANHLIQPMLPLIIRLKHHIDSYLDALKHKNTQSHDLFNSLLQKLTVLSDNISNSPFAEQQQISALAHIELLNGLIIRALICNLDSHNLDSPNIEATNQAFTLSNHLFEFANNLKLTSVWKRLGELWVSTSALMAYSGDNERLSHYISELEQHESQLHNLDNSINIAHCLVYKSWGYTQQDNKQKLQQSLEQLRIRSDKRNSPQLTGAYCHGIKLNINYIAEHDLNLAKRLVKQMLELSHRYPISDLYFACSWRISIYEQDQSQFDALLKLIDKVATSNIFNAELCLWLRHIHQSQQLTAIKNKLAEQNNLSAFSAALIKTACHTLVREPQSYIHRHNLWLQVLNSESENSPIIEHTKKILLVLGEYHQSPEPQQLLKLPPLERGLISIIVEGA